MSANNNMQLPTASHYEQTYNSLSYPQPTYNVPSAPVYADRILPQQYAILGDEDKKTKKTTCCTSGFSCLIALASLIVSIVAISLAGASLGSLKNSANSASIQRTFRMKANANSYNRNYYAPVGVSLLRGETVAVGYGYRQVTSGYLNENSGFGADTVLLRVSSQYFLAARSVQNGAYRSIVLSTFGYSSQSLSRYGETTLPIQAAVVRVLAFQLGKKGECGYESCKALIVFESTNKRVMGAIVNHQSGTTSFHREFEITREFSSNPKNLNVSIGTLDDNVVAMTVSSRDIGTPISYTAVCFISGNPICFTDSYGKNCKHHSVLPVNATKFITVCDQSYTYMWTVSVQSASITSETIYKTIFPKSETISVGPFARMLHDNSSFIIYYLDSASSLRAVFASLQYSYYRTAELVGNQQSVLIATNVNPTKDISVTVSNDDNSVFFAFQQQFGSYMLQAASIIENGQYLSLRIASYSSILNGIATEPLTTPQIAYNPASDYRYNDGVLLFFPLSESKYVTSYTNHYRYFDVYGGMNLFGVTLNRCGYSSTLCSTDVTVGGVTNLVTATNYLGGMYAGQEYYATQTGEISTDSVSIASGVAYPNKLLGVALNANELLLKM